MPPKLSSGERAWGTRYDSLGSSPPPSPPAHSGSASAVIPHMPPTSVSPSTPRHKAYDPHTESSSAANTNNLKNDKMPHDASIFVGSLPSHVDHAELTHLLTEHLSEHVEVKSVKVVRDTRGGVCAFVQCEDAHSAARLMGTLQHAPPRLFLGRYLRYEPARALRTLLISYRTPIQHIPPSPSFDDHVGRTAQQGCVELASAMRIYRPHNSKYPSVLYNEEAMNFQPQPAVSQVDGALGANDPFSGAGILFAPLSYDTEAVHILAHAFGPVERFAPHVADKDARTEEVEDVPKSRTYPHDAPRSPEMDPGIWEVKWEHRDDCVAALMTLRRIPHFTVTWAHHVFALGQSSDPRFASPHPSPNSQYSPYANRIRSYSDAHFSPANNYQRVIEASPLFQGPVPKQMDPNNTSSSEEGLTRSQSVEKWALCQGTPSIRNPLTSHRADDPSGVDKPEGRTTGLKWSDVDFPPLENPRENKQCVNIGAVHAGSIWGKRGPPGDDVEIKSLTSTSPSSSLSAQPATPVSGGGVNLPALDDEVISQPGSPNTYTSYNLDQGQELTVPPTPEFSASSITPITPQTGHSFPQTPQSAVGPELVDVLKSPGYGTPKQGRFEAREESGQELGDGRVLDPTTIFVGGLEMLGPNVWDEDKLKNLFSKYGVIEHIQLVRPMHKKSAFAFIKYNSADAGARAVAGEHNRIHDGRQIRVQLRENHPSPRSPWRYTRGRGRVHQFAPLRPHIDSHNDAGDVLRVDTNHTRFRRFDRHMGSPVCRERKESSDFGDVSGERLSKGETTGRGNFSSIRSIPAPGLHHSDGVTLARDASSQMSTVPGHSATASAPLTTSSPSADGPAAPVAGPVPQYPTPNVGYFPPQPWMHPYPAAYPYAVPFATGYMGYPPFPGHHGSPGFPTTDSNNSNLGMQNGWSAMNNSMYKPMVQYATYHPVNTANDPNQSQGYPHSGAQPPLRPTGFIQGEHGTLVPVYQPEALDQYLSSAGHSQSPPPHMPAQPLSASAWPQYPQMPLYPYVYPAAMAAPSPSHPTQGQTAPGMAPCQIGSGWVPSPSPMAFATQHHSQVHSTPPPYMVPSSSSSTLSSSSSFRGTYPGIFPVQQHQRYDQRNTPPLRRYQRRDQYQGHGHHHHHHHNRHANTRASPVRYPKGAQMIEPSYSFIEPVAPSQHVVGHSLRSSGSLPANLG